MANQEQFEILKQGVDVWNKWRKKYPKIQFPDIRQANLRDVDLTGGNLKGADLSGSDLWEANLSETNLTGANLSAAQLNEANLSLSILSGGILTGATLSGVDFTEAILEDVDMSGANLDFANFSNTLLRSSNFTGAYIGFTNFANVDLSQVIGLEKVIHDYSSYLSTDTIQLSKGKIPGVFLRGCGLADWEIESAKLYNPDLTNEEIVKIQYRIFDLRATRALQVSPLFISYSHADTAFVDHIDRALTEKGIRFWRDIHDAKSGRLETQIDRAIRQNPTVLLILSKNSLNSDWVEHEVRHARKLEKELGRDTLCPIALDDSWKSSPWPERVMEQIAEYNILDFSGWQDKSTFDRQFAKLLGGLEIFYKRPEA